MPVSKVRLTARRVNASVVAFPRRYSVYLTAPDNSSWVYIGNFSTQPTNGVVELDVRSGGVARRTYGVLISPTLLGADDHGNSYFQLSELGLLP